MLRGPVGPVIQADLTDTIVAVGNLMLQWSNFLSFPLSLSCIFLLSVILLHPPLRLSRASPTIDGYYYLDKRKYGGWIWQGHFDFNCCLDASSSFCHAVHNHYKEAAVIAAPTRQTYQDRDELKCQPLTHTHSGHARAGGQKTKSFCS